MSNAEFEISGDTAIVTLMYTKCKGSTKAVEVELCDVRAADGLRITYDFERDGWCVQQAQVFQWDVGDEPDQKWKEVAFIEAWASKLPSKFDDE